MRSNIKFFSRSPKDFIANSSGDLQKIFRKIFVIPCLLKRYYEDYPKPSKIMPVQFNFMPREQLLIIATFEGGVGHKWYFMTWHKLSLSKAI